MLEAAGQRVHLGGNIGTPPLELLHKGIKGDDWVVLELANFQLIDLRYSPHIAVCLMVVPEHLDWHGQMEEYVKAKSQLFAHQSQDDIAVYYANNATSQQVATVSPGRKIPYYAPPGAVVQDNTITIDGQAICKTDELKLLGKHNWQNVCAAVTAVWQITQDTDAMHSVLTNFSGLEHRLELVREFKGISYYNDSFGTTPETAMAAIEAFDQPQVVILGGRGKGVGFNELAQTVKANGHVARVLVIGEATEQIVAALDAAGYKDYVTSDAQTMPEIVQASTQLAETLTVSPDENIVVLLSTACTSFDMFDNYKQRGEAFRQAVQSLA
jgi:UDP-N-acetylmuramoylalanine--D-glutamate ligase